MNIKLNNNEFINVECCWQSTLSPKKECFVNYGKIAVDFEEHKFVDGTFSSNFEEVLKMLGFSPYQVRALIDYLYVNEVVLSIAKIQFNMRYSIEDRITQEKIISYENPVDCNDDYTHEFCMGVIGNVYENPELLKEGIKDGNN